MRAADINRLETTVMITKTLKVFSSLGGLDGPYSKAETISGFSELFPDQSKWLEEFGTVFNAEYVAQLLEHLQYDEPIELLTMYMCIFLVRDRSNKSNGMDLVVVTTFPFIMHRSVFVVWHVACRARHVFSVCLCDSAFA